MRAVLSSLVFHVPEFEDPRGVARCRRWLRHKGQYLSGRRSGAVGIKRCGRPVKWTATRSESLLLDNHARDQIVYGELALDENGKFLAVRSNAYQALGAYWWGAATAPLFWSVMFIPEPLRCADHSFQHQRRVHEHGANVRLSRRWSAGAIYLIERLVERAAQLSASIGSSCVGGT